MNVSGAGATVAAGALHLLNPNNTVAAGGTITTRGGGLTLSGTSGARLALASDNLTPATLALSGGITFAGSASGAYIDSTGSGNIPVTIDLGGLTQNIAVADAGQGYDLAISARISNGGIVKKGAGALISRVTTTTPASRRSSRGPSRSLR